MSVLFNTLSKVGLGFVKDDYCAELRPLLKHKPVLPTEALWDRTWIAVQMYFTPG